MNWPWRNWPWRRQPAPRLVPGLALRNGQTGKVLGPLTINDLRHALLGPVMQLRPDWSMPKVISAIDHAVRFIEHGTVPDDGEEAVGFSKR